MNQDRYFLTKNAENLLQNWYDNGKIIEVNGQIEQVMKCIYEIKTEWTKPQKELFEIICNEL